MKVSKSLSKVFGVIVSKADGTRIYSKYYDKVMSKSQLQVKEGLLSGIQAQLAFEKNLTKISAKLNIQSLLKPEDSTP